MTKKITQIAVHLSPETKEVIMSLAEQDGVSVSEFVCDLIESDLQRKFDKFSVLQRWVNNTGTVRTDGPE